VLAVWYLCLGYIIIGLGIGVIGLVISPFIEYDGDNEIIFKIGDALEDLFGTVLGSYILALPIVMVVCCYLTGRALGELS
jgi:MFS family permease